MVQQKKMGKTRQASGLDVAKSVGQGYSNEGQANNDSIPHHRGRPTRMGTRRNSVGRPSSPKMHNSNETKHRRRNISAANSSIESFQRLPKLPKYQYSSAAWKATQAVSNKYRSYQDACHRIIDCSVPKIRSICRKKNGCTSPDQL